MTRQEILANASRNIGDFINWINVGTASLNHKALRFMPGDSRGERSLRQLNEIQFNAEELKAEIGKLLTAIEDIKSRLEDCDE